MTKTSTLDTLASEQLSAQLAHVENRLAQDYALVGTPAVHELVVKERARFAHARIHVYVPILVERAVRETLALAAAKHRQDQPAV